MTLGLFNSLAHKIGMRKNGYKYSLNHYGAEIKRKKKNVFLILEVIMAGALDKWMMAAAALTSDRIGVTPLPFGVRR